MYLREAFKALEALNEDTFSVSDDGIQKLSEFEQNDDLIDDIPVIDLEAETEDDLQDSYVGKVILDCTVCHSKIYKDKSEVTVDDNVEFANVGEECPYCYTSDGFKIIGEVTEYGDTEEEVETDNTDNEDTEEDNKIEESLNNKDLSEATEFTEPELLGKGCCAPVATLPSERELRGIFKSLNSTNPQEKDWAKDDLNRLIERIKDIKQTFTNFDEYWKIHYQTALDAMQSLQDTINKELGDDTVNEFLDANVTLDARGFGGKDNNVSVLGSSLPMGESFEDGKDFRTDSSAHKLIDNFLGWYRDMYDDEETVKFLRRMDLTDEEITYYTDIDTTLYEGIFDNKAKKQQAYNKEIKEVCGKDATAFAYDIVKQATGLLQDVANAICDEANSTALAQSLYDTIKNAKAGIKKYPESLLRSIINMGRKYCFESSYHLDDLADNMKLMSKLQSNSKIGSKAREYLMGSINTKLVDSLNHTMSSLKREHNLRESKSIKEAPDADGILYDYEVGAKYNDIANAEMKQNAEYRKKIGELRVEISKLVPEVQEIINTLRESGETFYRIDIPYKGSGLRHSKAGAQICIDSKYGSNKLPKGSTYLKISQDDGSQNRISCSTTVTESGEILSDWDKGSWTNYSMQDPGYATVKALETFLDYFDAVKEKFYSEFNKTVESKSSKKINEATKVLPVPKGWTPSIENDEHTYEYSSDTVHCSVHIYNSFDNPKTIRIVTSIMDLKNPKNSTTIKTQKEVDNIDKDWDYTLLQAVYEADNILAAKGLIESCNKRINESISIKESVNNVNVETDDSIVNVATDDTGKVTVTTEPNTNTDKGDEVLAPLSDETEQEIVDNSFGEDEEFTDVDVEEFDEESFDELGESYLKNIYENVDSYKTSKVTQTDNKIKVEGVIKFTSGTSKNTTFLFEAKDVTKSGVVRFIGENVNITRGVKAFTIKGNVNNKKFITESFNYNYKTKKADGTLNRVFGTLTSRKG